MVHFFRETCRGYGTNVAFGVVLKGVLGLVRKHLTAQPLPSYRQPPPCLSTLTVIEDVRLLAEAGWRGRCCRRTTCSTWRAPSSTPTSCCHADRVASPPSSPSSDSATAFLWLDRTEG